MTKALLALTSLLFCLCAVLAGGLYLVWKRDSTLDIRKLSPNQAQALVEQYQATSASGLRYAYFEPKIGYNLFSSTKQSFWGDTFRSNELGYRTGSVKKDDDTYRVLFVGDSWAYGMGVPEQESFPHQFEDIANAHSGLEMRIDSWNLSLPGYNAINQLAAMEAFVDLIEPDAVVLCPTTNDIDGTKKVTRSGMLRNPRRSEWRELYLDWRSRYLDSYLNRTQWEETFDAYSTTARRMKDNATPFFMFFSADWFHEPVVHDFISRAGLVAPYTIVPSEFLTGEWRSRGIFRHGTPAAYTVFARIIYQMVAAELGWAKLPEPVKTRDGTHVGYYAEPPPGKWKTESASILRSNVGRFYDFKLGTEKRALQIISGVDWRSGAVSSNPAVILLTRKPGSSRLHLRVKSLLRARFLYPLDITVTIPSRSGTTSGSGRLSEAGGVEQTIEVDIPADIEPGSGIDLIIETPRSVLDEHFIARAFYLVGIEPS